MLPNELASARTKLKLSQGDLARRLGLSERQIRRYETGEKAIDPWLELAVESLQRGVDMMFDPRLIRSIRNAVSVQDLARIKAMMGLSEPEILFSAEELRAKVAELMGVLYFDDDDRDLWEEWDDADSGSSGELTPSELAAKFAEEWFERNFRSMRGLMLESAHFQEAELQRFFYKLIYESQDEAPADASDDSRDAHISAIEAWLEERFQPYTIKLVIDEESTAPAPA